MYIEQLIFEFHAAFFVSTLNAMQLVSAQCLKGFRCRWNFNVFFLSLWILGSFCFVLFRFSIEVIHRTKKQKSIEAMGTMSGWQERRKKKLKREKNANYEEAPQK